MFDGINLKPPIFEMGIKGYLYGKNALDFAKEADRISRKYGIQMIFDPQYVDIPAIVKETENLYIFAQHMDSVNIGVGVGKILPEALKAAGVSGTLLNHSEKRVSLSEISRTIKRADEVGLATLVCADSPQEAAAIAHLSPNMILAEPPELIGSGESVGKMQKEFISETLKLVKQINPEIIIFNSAGIKTPDDVRDVILLGAEGTGATSGILKAKDPVKIFEEMVAALKEAWVEKNNSRSL